VTGLYKHFKDGCPAGSGGGDLDHWSKRWEKGLKLGRNFPESVMVGRKFSAIERCFDII
jgi:hypothetical protein